MYSSPRAKIGIAILLSFFSSIGWPASLPNVYLPEIKILPGTSRDGHMTEMWSKAIRDRHDEAEFKILTKVPHPFQPDEIAWFEFIKREAAIWRTAIPALNAPFDSIKPPNNVVLLLGNFGGDDGFTYDTDTIGLDLRAWVENYGKPDRPGSADRVQRILSHEYTHLLVARWAKQRPPFARDTPYSRAIWRLFNEGLGNYYSLPQEWRAINGALPTISQKVQEQNIPILVDRLHRLKHADPNEETALVKGLTSGPFDKKWGAVTIALWLSEEQSLDANALRNFVSAGPQSVHKFIDRHLMRHSK